MSGLRASLFKDCKLLLKGSGWWSFLLPVLLFAALGAGMGDYSQKTVLQPFAIAVRDLDNTPMSRSLRGQMAQIELFSEIMPVQEGQPDEELLERGAAAVVTIPKDFFYTMYTMDNQEVQVTLNGAMPLESQLFGSMFESVMGIIQADQTAILGVYQTCYGELTPELEADLYAQASQRLIWDALSRQAVFDGGVTASDVQGHWSAVYLPARCRCCACFLRWRRRKPSLKSCGWAFWLGIGAPAAVWEPLRCPSCCAFWCWRSRPWAYCWRCSRESSW